MRTTAKQLESAVNQLREITGKNYILRYRDSRVGGYGVCIQHDKERGYSQGRDDFSGSAAEVYNQLWAAIRILQNYKQEQAEKPASFLSLEVNYAHPDEEYNEERHYPDTPEGMRAAMAYGTTVNIPQDGEDEPDIVCTELVLWRWTASKYAAEFEAQRLATWNADPDNNDPQTPTFNMDTHTHSPADQ